MILAAAAVVVVLLAAAYWEYTQDDVFITYVYSRNLAEGEGFVFNPGERVQGTTAPLYALLMAAIYPFTSDLLHAGNALSAVFLLGTIALAISLMRGYLSRYGQAAAALILATSPLIYVSIGMETLLYSLLLMLGFWLWARDARWHAMFVAAILTWVRPDGIVLAGALGLLALRRSVLTAQGALSWRDLPWKLALVYLAGIAPWCIFAWAYFGAPLPNTFSAKEEIFGGLRFWTEGIHWWETFYGLRNPLTLLGFPLALVGGWRAARLVSLRALPLWALLYIAGYTVLNVAAFWYYTPLFVVVVILSALGAEWLTQGLIDAGLRRPIGVAAAVILALVVVGLSAVRALDFSEPPLRVNTYRLVGQWINEHTPEDATLLVGDLGIVGYHARRRTIDSPGLVTPDMHFVNNDRYAVAKYKPDYVVTTQYFSWQRVVEGAWFDYHYAPVAQLSTPGDEFSPMTVFRRRLPRVMPSQVLRGYEIPLTCEVVLGAGQALPEETTARLFTPLGDLVVEVAHPFLWEQYPASRAAARERLVEQIALPARVPPGTYMWELTCDTTLQAEITVMPLEQMEGYTPLEAQWDDFALLQGATLPQGDATWSGGELVVTLQWQAQQPTEQDYSVFAHLVDAQDNLVAQQDSYPRDGSVLTSEWRPGQVIVDIRRIDLPPDLPEGDYTLRVGWYDWRTGERFMLAGDRDDAFQLPFSIHNRWP